MTCAIIRPDCSPPSRVRNAGSPLSVGSTSRSVRRSLIVASGTIAAASRSAAIAIGAPWKLPPETMSPLSANTIGLSVALLISTSSGLAHEPQRLADGAVHLRRAAQRIGVLHLAAVLVRLVDAAVAHQRFDVGGREPLADERPGRVDARLERVDRSAQRVDRERRRDVGGARDLIGGGQRQREHRGRGLRAVDERQPFFRSEPHRRQARPPSALRIRISTRRTSLRDSAASALIRRLRLASSWSSCVVVVVVIGQDLAFADQHEREMRERRQVAARADRSARRHARMHAGVEQRDQAPPAWRR